ncbi:MAG TPA: DUF167 family protein [Xanthobacteraceae bacterium]|jgi:hypothetical protein
MAERPWRPIEGGVSVAVRLTPKGGRDAVDGAERLADGTAVLKARVRVAAEDGAANAALVALLAKAVGVPRSRVELASGATARLKRLTISGDPARLMAALEALAGKGKA